MGKKRRTHVHLPENRGDLRSGIKATPRSTPDFHSDFFKSERNRKRMRLALVILMPLVLILLLEQGLSMAGYGFSTRYFVKMADGEHFTTNRRFGWRFMSKEVSTQPYPVLMDAQKDSGTKRVFILGESAALGTPAPAFGFARILEVMLNQQYPNQRFEIVNAAMRGINSHVILPIAQECAQHEPDLFLIYMGNNEAVGLYCPEPEGFNITPHLGWIRARQWINGTRVAQFASDFAALFTKTETKPTQTMDYFRQRRILPDHPGRQAVYRNFQENLRATLHQIRQSGAEAILSTVGVNLGDFPPLGSLHRSGLAADELARWQLSYKQGANAESQSQNAQAMHHYQAALALDDQYAELHFRMARCHLAQTNYALARQPFELARDRDALAFRTDRKLNELIREIGASDGNDWLQFLDAEKMFAEQAVEIPQTPGKEFFSDHVHLTFRGDYLLARLFLPAVVQALKLEPTSQAIPTQDECAQALAFTEWDDISVEAGMIRSQANPPFLDQLDHARTQAQANEMSQNRIKQFQPEGIPQAIQGYRMALANRPDDWQIRMNFGMLLSDFHQYPAAADEFRNAAQAMPAFVSLRLMLVKALWDSKQNRQAQQELQAALQLDPDYPPALQAKKMMAAFQ